MPIPADYSFTRYLAAKKTVDDRALNRYVWRCLERAVHERVGSAPLDVLEIGAGIGTMVERMLAWNLLRGDATLTAIDALPDNVAEARLRLPHWAKENGMAVEDGADGLIAVWDKTRRITMEWEAIDLFDFVDRERPSSGKAERHWDLVVAHAFLDLVHIPSSLPLILSLLKNGGLFYFTINFDGVTALEPPFDPAFDVQVEALYHQTMDQRVIGGRQSGDSRSGRRLFQYLRSAGAEILAAGSSDWVVFPGKEGYTADEAYFLHFIVHTVYTALWGHPQLDPSRLVAWADKRHAQIEQGELVYIAHQIDFVGRA